MSQGNVDALRWLYDAWAKGDLWALREIADPNIETENEIVALMCLHARAATTDLVLEEPVAAVWTLRDGKAVHVRYYDAGRKPSKPWGCASSAVTPHLASRVGRRRGPAAVAPAPSAANPRHFGAILGSPIRGETP